MYKTIASALLTLFAAAALASGLGARSDEQAPAAAPPPSEGKPSLVRLDRDGDRAVSRTEAEAHPPLVEQWQRLDWNEDGRLVQSELAAFEVGADTAER